MVIRERELEFAPLGVDDVLAMFEGRGGVEFRGDVELNGDAVRADGGLEFDPEAVFACLLPEHWLAFLIHADFSDGDVLDALLRGGAGAGFGLDTRGVEVAYGAGFHCGEEFIKLGAMIAFGRGLSGEAAQQRAGSLEDVSGEGGGFVRVRQKPLNDRLN